MKHVLASAALVMAAAGAAQAGCVDSEETCKTEMGEYHIALPDGVENPPVLLFLHGAGGNGKGALRMQAALDRGYALIGPNGLKRPNSRFGPGWSFHPDRPQRRDEIAFVREVIADAAAKHGINPDRVLLGGFSIGGSMVSYMACDAPDLAAAYAPVAGSFWRPHPDMQACQGPVKLMHTHGWKDKTVPLEGRPLRSTSAIKQGDVFYGMQIWRETNGCVGMRADTFDTSGDFWIRRWETCDAGALEFVMHPGAHGIPRGWSTMALDWFEGLAADS